MNWTQTQKGTFCPHFGREDVLKTVLIFITFISYVTVYFHDLFDIGKGNETSCF